jgi:hypothetical protein
MLMAARLGLKRGRPVKVAGVGSTTQGYRSEEVNARAGQILLPRNYLRLDLSKLGEACTNATVDGLVGAGFIS